jgi:hypothetical protein
VDLFKEKRDPHVVAGCLKLWLREVIITHIEIVTNCVHMVLRARCIPFHDLRALHSVTVS